ncbi:hypothetical protein CC80DRAFT_494390 [Byssothecium circinans]|uniref:Uncharacterized protein n=1 Tax=Byssothecium circinans TaxID=147558 RepID=A0A6A5TM56_9PLEO|nr:hypothetical protein CC80DRAFT_494390 [Byssothecium circinans]
MKLILSTVILSFAAGIVADNCKTGFNYCGWDLMNTGNYRDTIIAELQRVGTPADPNHIYNDLYYCKDNDGGINYVKACHGDNSCQYGGVGQNDYC